MKDNADGHPSPWNPVVPVKPIVKVDTRGQQYLVCPDGQVRRLDGNGAPLPRIKMSKKERIKYRREYLKIKDLESRELAGKIADNVMKELSQKEESDDIHVVAARAKALADDFE